MERSSLRSLATTTAAGTALLAALSGCAPAGTHRPGMFTQSALTRSASRTTDHGGPGSVPRDTTVRVVVIGDSLSTGLGTSPRQAWPKLLQSVHLPDKRAVEITNAAENGSGYLAIGEEGDTFGMEVQAAVTPEADVIIFFGSDNDMGADPDELRAAVESTLVAASSRAPKATLVAIGPMSGSDVPDQVLAEVRGSDASAAQNSGVEFIDPVADQWLSGRADVLLGPDGEHPSVKGQEFLRDKIKQIVSAAAPR
jgi:acyl-CoA thioesterase I